MKKVILLAILGLGVMATSCKKDYICECTTTSSGTDLFGDPIPTTSITATSTINAKKNDAISTCDAGDLSASFFGTTTKTECEIK